MAGTETEATDGDEAEELRTLVAPAEAQSIGAPIALRQIEA